MFGPIDYVVVGFEGNNFDGSIMRELSEAVDNGIIRVIDMLFIMKDKDGTVMAGEMSCQSEDIKSAVGDVSPHDDMPLLTESDVETVGEDMKPNTSAGILVIEHLWAKGLKQALINAGGFLIADGRIHPEKVQAALEEIEHENTATLAAKK